DECSVLVEPVQPSQDMCVRRGPCYLRQHVGIEQEPHNDKSRGSSRRRSTSRSRSRRGESSRNSANVPLRTVLRSHSSAETTTTLGLPLRVMVWGEVCARSITSENRALALATVHLISSLGADGIFTSMTILTSMTIEE